MRKKRGELERKPHLLREYLSHHEQNVGRNMAGKGHSVEVSDGNEKHVTGNWRKADPRYKVVKNLIDLCSCSSVLWKAMKLDI